MDVVYLLGTGSGWQNNEFRFSVRSVEKYLLDFRDIYSVGYCPSFAKGIINVDVQDSTKDRPAFNTYTKLMAVCRMDKVSDDFILMNDDFILRQQMKTSDIKFWYDMTLETYLQYYKRNADGRYYARIEETLDYLVQNGMSTKRFSLHYPIIINKEKFLTHMSKLDWNNKEYVTRTIYGNAIGEEGVRMDDCKTNDPEIAMEFPCFSLKPGVMMQMKHYLMREFPVKSKYEQ